MRPPWYKENSSGNALVSVIKLFLAEGGTRLARERERERDTVISSIGSEIHFRRGTKRKYVSAHIREDYILVLINHLITSCERALAHKLLIVVPGGLIHVRITENLGRGALKEIKRHVSGRKSMEVSLVGSCVFYIWKQNYENVKEQDVL